MFHDILIATDGTENSRPAIETGLAMASAFGSTVHAVSVAPARKGETHRDQIRTDPESDAREAIADVETRAEQESLEFVGAIPHGDPHEELLNYVGEHPVDAVVMGTHGRSGFDRVVIGSVAEKTVRNAPVPVMVVPPADNTRGRSDTAD